MQVDIIINTAKASNIILLKRDANDDIHICSTININYLIILF